MAGFIVWIGCAALICAILLIGAIAHDNAARSVQADPALPVALTEDEQARLVEWSKHKGIGQDIAYALGDVEVREDPLY